LTKGGLAIAPTADSLIAALYSCAGVIMPNLKSVIRRSRDVLGGIPVFAGTRVPVQSLIDYLEAGQTLGEFLEDFPTVNREQVIAVLEQVKETLLSDASAAR
jgi:uncharacterized protein (DUF433 family)